MLFSLTAPPARSQQPPDSAAIDGTAAVLQRYVRNELGPDSRLYNGYEYIRNGTPAKGFPFFESDSLQKAGLSYDGILYPSIPMEYDIVLDRVIIRDYTGSALISLISEKVASFSFGTHHFRYVPDIDNPGFYEVLFSSPASYIASAADVTPATSGPVTLLAHREKKLIFPSNREDQARYDQKSFYFIRLANRFYTVDTKAALLDVFKDKKEALKKFISGNNISFKHQFETALTRTTAYYTHLSH
jgi:hypothetical protein